MIDFLGFCRLLLDVLLDLGRLSGRKLIQPMLTVACLTGTYAAVHVGQEGSFSRGLRAAFLDDDITRQERRRTKEVANLQAELRQFAAANKLIDQLLESMLGRAAGASRVQLAVIHNGITGLTGTAMLRYDATNSVATRGRLAGPAVTNQPLADWSDFLPALMAGQCAFHRIADLHAGAIRGRFEMFGADGVLVCPSADVQGKIVGAIFMFWDDADKMPAQAELKVLMADGQHLGAQIAAVLDLQGPPPWPSESTAHP